MIFFYLLLLLPTLISCREKNDELIPYQINPDDVLPIINQQLDEIDFLKANYTWPTLGEKVEEDVVLVVPAIPLCEKKFAYDFAVGYCLKFDYDEDILPICKPCSSPDQILQGSTCVGRKYSPKGLSCNLMGDPKKDEKTNWMLNDDGLCIRTQVYVPMTYCPVGFAKKKVKYERVCMKEDTFVPYVKCENPDESEKDVSPSLMKYDPLVKKCYTESSFSKTIVPKIYPSLGERININALDYRYESTIVGESLACPENFTLTARNVTKANPSNVDIDYQRLSRPEAYDVPDEGPDGNEVVTEFTCTQRIYHNYYRPKFYCPKKSKYNAKKELCTRILVSQRLPLPKCHKGWFYNPSSRLCQAAEVKTPFLTCIKPFVDNLSDDINKMCVSEKKEMADCVCPAGTVPKPPHKDYPNWAKKRKTKKCSHVIQMLPKFSCEHVAGYTLTHHRQCELRIKPSEIIAPRVREKYRLKEYKYPRQEIRAMIRQIVMAKIQNKYTKISLPQEVQPYFEHNYGDLRSCLDIADPNTLEIPYNKDNIPQACVDEATLINIRDQIEAQKNASDLAKVYFGNPLPVESMIRANTSPLPMPYPGKNPALIPPQGTNPSPASSSSSSPAQHTSLPSVTADSSEQISTQFDYDLSPEELEAEVSKLQMRITDDDDSEEYTQDTEGEEEDIEGTGRSTRRGRNGFESINIIHFTDFAEYEQSMEKNVPLDELYGNVNNYPYSKFMEDLSDSRHEVTYLGGRDRSRIERGERGEKTGGEEMDQSNDSDLSFGRGRRREARKKVQSVMTHYGAVMLSEEKSAASSYAKEPSDLPYVEPTTVNRSSRGRSSRNNSFNDDSDVYEHTETVYPIGTSRLSAVF